MKPGWDKCPRKTVEIKPTMAKHCEGQKRDFQWPGIECPGGGADFQEQEAQGARPEQSKHSGKAPGVE